MKKILISLACFVVSLGFFINNNSYANPIPAPNCSDYCPFEDWYRDYERKPDIYLYGLFEFHSIKTTNNKPRLYTVITDTFGYGGLFRFDMDNNNDQTNDKICLYGDKTLETAPYVDSDGLVHVYGYSITSTTLRLIDMDSADCDTPLRSYDSGGSSGNETEGLGIDETDPNDPRLVLPLNKRIVSVKLAKKDPGAPEGIRGYEEAWSYNDYGNFSNAGSGAPLVIGDYVYAQERQYGGQGQIEEHIIHKINRLTGTPATPVAKTINLWKNDIHDPEGFLATYAGPISDDGSSIFTLGGSRHEIVRIDTADMSKKWEKDFFNEYVFDDIPVITHSPSYHDNELVVAVGDVLSKKGILGKVFFGLNASSGNIDWINDSLWEKRFGASNFVIAPTSDGQKKYVLILTSKALPPPDFEDYTDVNGELVLMDLYTGDIDYIFPLRAGGTCASINTAWNGKIPLSEHYEILQVLTLGTGSNADSQHFKGNEYHNGYVGDKLVLDMDLINSEDDGDGVDDSIDNCPHIYNPKSDWVDIYGVSHYDEQTDYDLDGIGDAGDNCRAVMPVKVGGAYYSTLQSGYNSPMYNGTIKSQHQDFYGDLIMNLDKDIILEAGYDCDYINKTIDGTTEIHGYMEISDGHLDIAKGHLIIGKR